MSKVSGEWDEDIHGRTCIVLNKSKGHINQREVDEWLREHRLSEQSFIHMIDCPEQIPEHLYEEGDVRVLYEPEIIMGEIVEKANMNTDCGYKIIRE
jgi:hypothetical protein